MQLSFLPKKYKRRKRIKFAVIVVLLSFITVQTSAILLNNLYFEKLALREAKKLSMSHSEANAIKHAYAASLTYSSLRKIWFSKDLAQDATIFLGKVHEVSESVLKPNRDSSLEMMKDMANNMMGICVAQWLEEHKQSVEKNRLSLIRHMAQQRVLISDRDNLKLEEDAKQRARTSFKFYIARDWFDDNKDKIKIRAQKFLRD